MKIVHFCLSCFYIDGYAYQENQLVAQHVADGHEVTVIASTETYSNGVLSYGGHREYMGTDGAPVIRLPYRSFLPTKLARKIRSYPGVRKLLEKLRPDAILFHGMCAWELGTVARYVRETPAVTLYVDCHEDFNNSARGWLSRNLLHAAFYRPVLHAALPVVKEILGVTVESVSFARDFYGVPAEKIRLYPLGGHVQNNATYSAKRERLRQAHGISPDDVVIVQSGKIIANKLLPAALKAFQQVASDRLRFYIIGQIVDAREECEGLIASDPRIHFLGWKSPTELEDFLCAADVYLQPWGQTATTQMSMCCRCATILEDLPSHRALYADNGFLLNGEMSLRAAFEKLVLPETDISGMQQRSFEFAKEYLDYVRLAQRIYQ